ncbi:MAG: DUF1330 domain-containing protein [Laribacter sp.]|nr:DUF1330 domain-containing protein [Laribacter sp.]MBP9608339.1 DUF1330 domain-containing protein [Laribacter sp.]
MANAYVVGHLTVKDSELWNEYRDKVPATLIPWKGELVFRGKQVSVLSGDSPHPGIVVICFPSLAEAQGWFSSLAYQALIPLRQQAAEMVLSIYKE